MNRKSSNAAAARAFQWTGCVIAVAAIFAFGLAPSLAHSLKDLEDKLKKREAYVQIVHEAAAEFTLQDAHGRSVGLADFRGQVVVLNFVYTNCPDVCPLHSERIAEIQEMVNRTPMRDIIQFISITTDPTNDAPEVMKAYGPAHGLDPANWIFLTSGADEPEATRDLARDYGLIFTLRDGGYQLHGVVTHLIDKSGNLRANYHGLKFHPTNFILHVNALTNDDH
jgi:protein SCO1/2